MKRIIFTEIFTEPPHEFAKAKGSQRIQINNILSAIAVAIIAILISNNSTVKISDWIITQLSASIPLLITSSLFYAKTCYRGKKEYPYWNFAGGIAHSLGYFGIINAITLLMYFGGYLIASWVLIISVFFLVILYSSMDVMLNKKRLVEKIIKFVLYISIIAIGTYPMLKIELGG